MTSTNVTPSSLGDFRLDAVVTEIVHLTSIVAVPILTGCSSGNARRPGVWNVAFSEAYERPRFATLKLEPMLSAEGWGVAIPVPCSEPDEGRMSLVCCQPLDWTILTAFRRAANRLTQDIC